MCRLDTEAKLLTNDELRAVLAEEVAACQREGQVPTHLKQAGLSVKSNLMWGFLSPLPPGAVSGRMSNAATVPLRCGDNRCNHMPQLEESLEQRGAGATTEQIRQFIEAVNVSLHVC